MESLQDLMADVQYAGTDLAYLNPADSTQILDYCDLIENLVHEIRGRVKGGE